VVSGGDQQGAAGLDLAAPVAVKVTDSRGHPVAGQAVTFEVTGGGGSVYSGSATTDAGGMAQERWRLGTQAGAPQRLEARVATGSGATLVAVVTATATPGIPAVVTRVTPGETLGGVVNSLVGDTLAVRVSDAFGNPVPGTAVTWGATAGSGETTAPTSTTDANGIAKMTWRLGPAANQLHVAVAAITGAGVSFGALAADAMQMQNASGGTVVPGVPIDVRVLLFSGMGPVPNVTVHWQASSGTVNPAVSKTGSHAADIGLASTQWTPGATPGTQTLTATAGSLTATLTVTVLGSATRTLLTQVPGQVLDVSPDYVLWLDPGGAAPAFRRRRLSDGTDQTASVSPGTGQPVAVRGSLSGGNALLRTQAGDFYLWRTDGSLTSLGVGEGLPSAEGQWAAWRVNNGEIVRADLSTGSIVHIATTDATSIDVGMNGDVVWLDYVNTSWLYHNGAMTQVTTQGNGAVRQIATDGVNVIYLKVDTNNNGTLRLDNGNSDVGLAFSAGPGFPTIYAVMNGGWMAYNPPNDRVVRRSPQGFFQYVSPEASGLVVAAITSDGTVVYENGATGRYYLVTPALARVDAGPALTAYYLARGPYLFAIAGGAVYRVTP
jgi:hypothetical protein